MSAELVAIILTGVVSGLDLLVNVFTMCMTGSCRSSCCNCFEFEHDDEQHQTPRFTFTESVVNKMTKKNENKKDDK